MQDWKTTISGALLAAVNLFFHSLDWKTAAVSAFTLLLGAIAKDPKP